jgi:hypothetical protein
MKDNPKRQSRFKTVKRKRWIIYIALFIIFLIFVLADM